jgi:hypothetical protein
MASFKQKGILFLLIIIILFIYQHKKVKLRDNFKSKSKVVVCLFGVIPRSIKYTWNSINKNIVEPLKKEYDVDIYIFNLNVEDTKVDGVKLNQKDIEIIPYDYKEEEKQSLIDNDIVKICSKTECKIHKYKPETVKNALRQLYSEQRVGEFLKKNKDKYDGAVVCGPDYYILNSIKIDDFKNSTQLNNHIFVTNVNKGSNNGYTNGLYFGKIDNLNKILFRYSNLTSHIPTVKDYEYILREAADNHNLKVKISDIIFLKIRANKKAILQTKPQHINLIKNYDGVQNKLKNLNNSLNN